MLPIDAITFNLLQEALADPLQAKQFQERWRAEAATSSFAEYLVRENVFSPEAPRTISLISKGYLRIDGARLLHPDWLMPRGITPTPATEKHLVVHQTIEMAADETDKIRRRELQRTSPEKEIPIVTSVSPDASVGLGTRIGRCILTRELGEGGGGSVYEAVHSGLGIRVAVKLLRATNEEGSRQALRAEARLLAQLNHSHIVRVYDYDDEFPIPHLVMELVEGVSLADLIVQSGGLRPDRALEVIMQTAFGLEAACQLGIIHRDVKPGNILLNKEGIVKVADLGLAVTNQERLSQATGAVSVERAGTGGTAAYMAPERFRGQGAVDFRSDIYSLGVTFFEALTGQLPFSGDNAMELMIQHADAPIPDVTRLRPGLPPQFATTIQRMMAKNANDRYLSYTTLITDLEGLKATLMGGGYRVEHSVPESLTSTGSRLLSRLLQFRSNPPRGPNPN